jgi:site-specific recombinase XerD
VQAMLEHEDPSTTQIYAHLQPQEFAAVRAVTDS